MNLSSDGISYALQIHTALISEVIKHVGRS